MKIVEFEKGGFAVRSGWWPFYSYADKDDYPTANNPKWWSSICPDIAYRSSAVATLEEARKIRDKMVRNSKQSLRVKRIINQ